MGAAPRQYLWINHGYSQKNNCSDAYSVHRTSSRGYHKKAFWVLGTRRSEGGPSIRTPWFKPLKERSWKARTRLEGREKGGALRAASGELSGRRNRNPKEERGLWVPGTKGNSPSLGARAGIFTGRGNTPQPKGGGSWSREDDPGPGIIWAPREGVWPQGGLFGFKPGANLQIWPRKGGGKFALLRLLVGTVGGVEDTYTSGMEVRWNQTASHTGPRKYCVTHTTTRG